MAPTSPTGQDKARLAMAAAGVILLLLAVGLSGSRSERAGAEPAAEPVGAPAPAASTGPTLPSRRHDEVSAAKAPAADETHDHDDHDHTDHEGHDHEGHAEPESTPAVKAALIGESPLAAVSPTSRLLVLELSGQSARLLEAVTKDVAYRKSQRAKAGAWQLVLLDDAGAELDAIPFEAAGLCPLAGEGHATDHVMGHVVLEHKTSIMVRIPDVGARAAEVRRLLPDLDETPKTLGRFALPTDQR